MSHAQCWHDELLTDVDHVSSTCSMHDELLTDVGMNVTCSMHDELLTDVDDVSSVNI